MEVKFKFSRTIATISMLLICIMLFIYALIFVVTEIVQGTSYLAEVLPVHFEDFIIFLEQCLDKYIMPHYHNTISYFQTLPNEQQFVINENIEKLTTGLAVSGASFLQNLILQITAAVGILPNALTIILIILIATFFITNDWARLSTGFQKIIPVKLAIILKDILFYLNKAFFGLIKAQCILITITGILTLIGLLILKVEHAPTITLLAVSIDLLPYLGTGIIFIPWIIYQFLTGNYSMTIGLSVLYIVIILTRQIIEPKVLSTNLGIHPLAMLMAMFVGIQLWGIFGLLAAPFILIIINAFYQANVVAHLWQFIKS